ncbi:MAG TPA: SRPBCC domain-containing protein [Caulobacteraceae bacterium]|jgi:uncharacterized protein YndB with AHSA1/START domain|nr:SRPBCC domain-containing protein [Caulobacteraceae bacterium]
MPVLRISRRFEATPERLFDAWTDPRFAAAWLFTEATSEHHATELDVRVGGRWRIVDRRGGVEYTALGEYLEVDRPHRLAFTFGMPQFSPDFDTVTVEIAADGAGALMTLTQERPPAGALAAIEEGWRRMFDELEARLALA